MTRWRHGWLALGLLMTVPGLAVAQRQAPVSDWATQGAFGAGAGPDGLTFSASIGPRYRKNLLSLRGSAAIDLSPASGRASVISDLGLTLGRLFCSGKVCITPVIGGGITSQAVDSFTEGETREKATTGALLWEIRLVTRIGQTTGLGVSVLGDQNSQHNFWAVLVCLQPGLPRL